VKFEIPEPVRHLFRDKSLKLYAIGLAFLVAVVVISQAGSKEKSGVVSTGKDAIDSPDTVIPKGFVLVPIELQNAESLAAMVDQYAIVDLYSVPRTNEEARAKTTQGPGHRVGYHLRLLRAPANPKTFAVLVPEAQAPGVVAMAGALFAVIQNPNQNGTGGLDKTQKISGRVNYYSGSKL